jgi:hypothetical protein
VDESPSSAASCAFVIRRLSKERVEDSSVFILLHEHSPTFRSTAFDYF